jgi:hypothetical protein
VSTAAFVDAGFTSGTLLGEKASSRLLTSMRIRFSSRGERLASTRSCPAVCPAAR